MITLYDYELSGNCYKLRLFMNMLGVKHETKSVDFYPGREHKSEWFLKLNPLGQLPVLKDDDLVLRDAQAILVYLASRYDGSGRWYPRDDAAALGRISMWLSFADAITATASAARLHDGLFYKIDIDAARAGAHRLFRILDEYLWFAEQEGQDFIASRVHPTIADIACFPYVILSEEGGISRQEFPAIRRWCDRFKRTPGFIVMSGIFPTAPPLMSTDCARHVGRRGPLSDRPGYELLLQAFGGLMSIDGERGRARQSSFPKIGPHFGHEAGANSTTSLTKSIKSRGDIDGGNFIAPFIIRQFAILYAALNWSSSVNSPMNTSCISQRLPTPATVATSSA